MNRTIQNYTREQYTNLSEAYDFYNKNLFDSTLVHEMCHLWQYAHGTPSRRTYHNTEWSTKMQEVGLMPSSTGKPGGKKTGQKISDYIIEGGKFEVETKKLLDKGLINWEGLPMVEKSKVKKRNKIKYTCPDCGANVWGKPNMHIKCGDCESTFEEAAENE